MALNSHGPGDKPDPKDLGADEIVSKANENGGEHFTAYSETGGQISWDTDSNGNHVDNSEHLSDRNCGGDTWSSW